MTYSLGNKTGYFPKLYTWFSQDDPFIVILQWIYISFSAFKEPSSLSVPWVPAQVLWVRQVGIILPISCKENWVSGKSNWPENHHLGKEWTRVPSRSPDSSESRTLTPQLGFSNTVVADFQGGAPSNFFEDSTFLSAQMQRDRSTDKG